MLITRLSNAYEWAYTCVSAALVRVGRWTPRDTAPRCSAFHETRIDEHIPNLTCLRSQLHSAGPSFLLSYTTAKNLERYHFFFTPSSFFFCIQRQIYFAHFSFTIKLYESFCIKKNNWCGKLLVFFSWPDINELSLKLWKRLFFVSVF